MRFPRYLHQPMQILWFEPDDVVVTGLCLVLAFNLFTIWAWLTVFIVPYYYMKTKSKYPRGYFRHFFYFLGLINFEHVPSYFEKKWQE